MLNDPFVNAMAKHWAGELMKFQGSAEDIIRHVFDRAYSREPTAAEFKRWTAFLKEGRFLTAQALEKRLSLEAVAHAIFNTKEFIYYR